MNYLENNTAIYVWGNRGTALNKNNIQTVKFGGGSIMIWGCISYNGTGELEIIYVGMVGRLFLWIIENNLLKSDLSLEHDEDFCFKKTRITIA